MRAKPEGALLCNLHSPAAGTELFVPLHARIETSFPATLVQKNAHAGGVVDPCVFYPGVWICGPGLGREKGPCGLGVDLMIISSLT